MQGNGSGEQRPAGDPPGEPRPAGDRPAEQRPVGERPAEQPSGQRSAEARPPDQRPAEQSPPRKPERSAFETAERKRRNAIIVRLVLGLTLLVLFVIFVSLNSDSVRVHFIFAETRAPLVWVFLVCALIGGLVAFLLGRPGRRASRKYIKELERRLEDRRDKSS